MKNKIYPTIWLLIGIIELYIGIDGYIKYTSGRLFLFMLPEQIEVKNILFGLSSIIISAGLYLNPKKTIDWIIAIPVWVLIFIVTGTIQYAINRNSFDLTYFLILDYWFIVLSFLTIKELKKEFNEKDEIIRRLKKINWRFLITSGIIINLLIFIIAEIITYELLMKLQSITANHSP